MGALLSLIGGIRGIVFLALVLLLGGWAATLKHNADKAYAARDAAIVQRDNAAVQLERSIAAAKKNEETIARLTEEKELANEALNNLQAARVSNKTNTVTRQVVIRNQAAVPANSAVAAPVLGSIVDEVQKDRVRRRGP